MPRYIYFSARSYLRVEQRETLSPFNQTLNPPEKQLVYRLNSNFNYCRRRPFGIFVLSIQGDLSLRLTNSCLKFLDVEFLSYIFRRRLREKYTLMYIRVHSVILLHCCSLGAILFFGGIFSRNNKSVIFVGHFE